MQSVNEFIYLFNYINKISQFTDYFEQIPVR